MEKFCFINKNEYYDKQGKELVVDLRCTKHYIIGTCQFKHKSILFRACELI